MTGSQPSATSGGQALPVPGDVPIPPALVNFVLTACKPGFAAYQATILDLAARGFLTASSGPDDIWLAGHAATDVPANTAELAHYEQLVLRDMSRRLAGTDGAPFQVLAEACEKDAQHIWVPFAESLHAEATRRDLSQPRRDRLTAYGTQLAARLAGERAALPSDAATRTAAASANAELGRRAFAVAATVPAPVGPSAPRRRRGSVAQTEAWSAFSGTWRLVKIGPAPQERMIPLQGVVALAFAVWFAGIAIVLAINSDVRIWSLPFVLVAVVLGTSGVARLSATLSQPRRQTFSGQVIACWGDVFQDEDPYCVVDDGERAWTFTGVAATYVKLDDLVDVAMNPRTGRLITLHVTERLRQDPYAQLPLPVPSPAESLVSTAEVESLIGSVQRTSPMPVLGGHGVLYQGQAGRVTVMVVSGNLARLGATIRRSRATPVPGTGGEYWLLNDGRTLAVKVANTVATVILSGRAVPRRPELLAEVATKIAVRLESREAE